jgi:hypothetical protein
MSDTDDISTDDDINEQLIIAAVDRLREAVRSAKQAGAPLANALYKRHRVATLDALTSFFDEQATEQRTTRKRESRLRKKER